MTRAIRHGLLKDESRSVGGLDAVEDHGTINQHLRSHVHLTNCIHLKNHMHCHSPVQGEKSLMRDLVVLQRSKSLRDPSTSPPSWLSPFVISTLVKRSSKDAGVQSGRRSIGVDIAREVARSSVNFPKTFGSTSLSAAAVETVGDHSVGKESRDGETRKREDGNPRLKTLSERLQEIPSHTDTDNQHHSHGRLYRNQRSQPRVDKRSKELKLNHTQPSGFGRRKRRKFRGARRSQGSIESGDGRVLNGISVPSTSFTQGFTHHKCCLGEERAGQENDEVDVSQAPRQGCGIPWNWSRIHHRGKTFLDIAGRSLSCGLSDSRVKKDGSSVQQSQKDKAKIPVLSQELSSTTGSDTEALPFLLDPSGSPESNLNHCTSRVCSGELGLYADNNYHEIDSDLMSEARTGNQPSTRKWHKGRHQSLTQKYMPKTFKDIVGQSLVVQALTNAVLRKKIGLIYVFYGPHGTGKTSCARVFAKSLNCQSSEQSKPCDLCTSCVSHNLGKNRSLLEIGAVSSFDDARIIDALNTAIISTSTSYSVFIVDDCDSLPCDSWMAISKLAHRAPRHVVFILISSSLDHLPHAITCRCQKFYFPKVKEIDIVHTLQWISSSEGLDIENDALKLIASRSNGSLRDAEMTLDQLGLLGQRISLPLVQELVGLVSDEKLVDLLDVALSADTVNTIKSLREIIETGVEPLSLMSQLATLITDILAGSYIFTREGVGRVFFRRQTLSKEEMERLRQALQTLSEAEKNLRLSNDNKLTWLTAALLQIVPDQQYGMPGSSMETNFNQSPLLFNRIDERMETGNAANEEDEVYYNNRKLSRSAWLGSQGNREIKKSMQVNSNTNNNNIGGKEHSGHALDTMQIIGAAEENFSYKLGRSFKGYGKIWQEVIESIESDALKQFLSQEGRLSSIRASSAPTVQLIFESSSSKSKAERFRGPISQALASVLNTSVILEIKCDSEKDDRQDDQVTHNTHVSDSSSSIMSKIKQSISKQSSLTPLPEIPIKPVPITTAMKGNRSRQARQLQHLFIAKRKDRKGKGSEFARVGEGSSNGSIVPISGRKPSEDLKQSKSLVKSKVSLAHVIQQAEGSSNHGGWSGYKSISIAEKLEQENMRLEPQSRSLLCWKVPRVAARSKRLLSRAKTRNPRYLLKLVTCSRCLSSRTPR